MNIHRPGAPRARSGRVVVGAALAITSLLGASAALATTAAAAAPADGAGALDAALAGTPVPALEKGESFSTTATVLVGEGPGTTERSGTRTCTAAGCTTVLADGELLTQGAALPARAGVSAGHATTPRFLFANGRGPARWNPCGVITWRVRPNNMPAGLLGRLSAAVGKMSAASGLTYRYAGQTSFLPFTGKKPREAADLYVAVATQGEHPAIKPGVWGYGTVSVKTHRDGVMEVVNGYMMLNRAMFNYGPYFPVDNVLMHELGHTVNLDHVDNYTQVMNPYSTNIVNYGSVDRAGLRRVGRPAGCIRSR